MFLTVKHFLPLLRGYYVLVCVDNTLVVTSAVCVSVPFAADSALGRRENQVARSSLHSGACKLGCKLGGPVEVGTEAQGMATPSCGFVHLRGDDPLSPLAETQCLIPLLREPWLYA